MSGASYYFRGFLIFGILGAVLRAEPQVPESALQFHTVPKPLSPEAVTEDWPRFLGPHDNATSGETPLLDTWPREGLKVVWEMQTGEGYGSAVISGGRLLYFHRLGGRETLECLDPESGQRRWQFSYPVDYEDRYGFSPGPRSSPVIDDGRVYLVGVTADFHCLDLETGKVLWKRDLMKEFRIPRYFFGYGPTPAVWKDRVIVNVGGRGARGGPGTCVAALDKRTGKTLWEVRDDWGASYASPVVARLRGRDCALVLAAGESKPSHGGLLTIDAKTGKVYDRFPWRARKYESVIASSPLAIGEHRVFISECYEKGGVLLEFDQDLESKPLWTQREFGMHWMMPVAIDGHLYGFAGRNTPDVEFRCAELATGRIAWSNEMRWEEDGKIRSLFRGSLLRTGRRTFALGEDGTLAELELSPRGPVTKQRVRLFTARETWTLPAIHRGLLYVVQNSRDPGANKLPRLICYDLRD